MGPDSIALSSDALELHLSPCIGGAISRLDFVGAGGRTPILRESHTPLENVLGAASFPLVPYVNRIRGGRFEFRGRTVGIAPNMPGDPSPLHGDGWLNPWDVERADGSSAAWREAAAPAVLAGSGAGASLTDGKPGAELAIHGCRPPDLGAPVPRRPAAVEHAVGSRAGARLPLARRPDGVARSVDVGRGRAHDNVRGR